MSLVVKKEANIAIKIDIDTKSGSYTPLIIRLGSWSVTKNADSILAQKLVFKWVV